MRKRIKTLLALLLTLTGCGVKDSTTDKSSTAETADPLLQREMKEVPMEFSINDISSFEINPYIYGTFIEHIETCIYNGIWSEVIMDRKFYAPIGKDVSQWSIKKGTVDSGSESPFEGKYSPVLNKDSSIIQRGIAVDSKNYNGYLYAKGNGTLTLIYTIDSKEVRKEIKVSSSDYQKYTYSFLSPSKTKRRRLRFSLTLAISASTLFP